MENPNQALIQAVIDNEPSKVKHLLADGADPNFFECAHDKIRLIHLAALYNAERVVPHLVKAGADLSAKTGADGVTALEIAKQHRFRQMARLLQSFRHSISRSEALLVE